MHSEREHSKDTRAIHAGEPENASAMPLYMAATVEGRYQRSANPTVDALEAKIAELEGAKRAAATACGMAAATQTLMAFLETGDRVVVHHTVYIGVQQFMKLFLPGLGVDVAVIDMTDLAQLEEALSTPTRVVYFEPISNPSMEVINAPKAIDLAHTHGAVCVLDNTFLSPYLYQPLADGADVVVHSATKYLSGHGDVLGGVMSTADEELGDRLHLSRKLFGGIMSPANASLMLRGMLTLPVRMKQHCANAQRVAEFLEQHPKVAHVFYPGLPSSPYHAVASSYLGAFGGMLGFDVQDDVDAAALPGQLTVAKPWVSLGDVKSLAVHQGGPKRVRMSVGLEDPDDLIQDLDQALG